MKQELLFYKDYTLPSKGMIYSYNVNKGITLRGLNKLEVEIFKSLNDKSLIELSYLLDSALEKTLNIPSSELCYIDFEFLLFKLRTLTFGYDLSTYSTCSNCNTINKININISGLDLKTIDDVDINSLMNITLPKSDAKIELRFKTIKEIDYINKKENMDLNNIIYSIKKVNGEILSLSMLEKFVSDLNLFDKRILNKAINDLNNSFGINKSFKVTCGKCKKEYKGFLIGLI